MGRVDYNDMIKFEEEICKKHRLFEGIDLLPLTTYQGMDTSPAREFKTPLAIGFYKAYTIKGDSKIEKIVIGELHYMKRAKYCLMNMTATDDYDLPIYAIEFDQSAKRIGVTLDLMPLVDIGMHPEYFEKYLKPLGNLWRKYRTIPGFTIDNRCLVQRRYAAWPWARETLSPYCLDGRLDEQEHGYILLEAAVAYARVWLNFWREAQPIKDPEYKKEMLFRKKTLQRLYRDRDPGGEVMKKLFGDEQHKLFVSLAF